MAECLKRMGAWSPWCTGMAVLVASQIAVAQDKVPAGEAGGEEGQPVYETEDTVVTGTRTEKRRLDSPVKTQLIGHEEIEQKQAFNLAEALDETTGVRVEDNCQNCGFTQVRLNGLEGKYTQILIDGRPVVSSLAGVYLLEQIPSEMIERIEVVKGGGSALYGGNAVAGVLNIITRRPSLNFGAVSLQGGAVGLGAVDSRFSADGGLVNEHKTLALHVFGSAQAREPWDQNDDGFSEIGMLRSVSVGAESYFRPSSSTDLALKFQVLREHRRGGDHLDRPEHDAAIAESIHTMRYGGELRFKHEVSPLFDYEVGYGIAFTERNSYYGAGGDVDVPDLPETPAGWDKDHSYQSFVHDYQQKQGAYKAYGRTKNPLHTGDAVANFTYEALGKQVVTAGFQFLVDNLDDYFPGYDWKTEDTYTDFAGFVQHDWEFAGWGESILGVRVDKHSEMDKPAVSPRVALMFKPLSGLRLRTSFSTGFRAPQVFDEDLHITIIGGQGQITTNDPGLGPEKSYSVAQQVEYSTNLAHGWSLRAGLNGFFSLIRNQFVLDEQDDPNTPDAIEFVRKNRGRATVYGAEAEIHARWKRLLELNAGWTWERARNAEPDPDFNSKTVYRTPETYGYLEALLWPVGGLEIRTSLDVTGPMDVPHYAGFIPQNALERSPWFFDWDLGVSYTHSFSDHIYIKPFLNARNLLNSYQDDFDTGPNRDAGYIYGPRMPRSLWAGVKCGF